MSVSLVPCNFFLLSAITAILILFSFKILSSSFSFSPSPLIFQVAYLNCNTFFASVSSFKENLSSFFPWDLPVVEISPEWVMGPEQVKSGGRVATFSLWTGLFSCGCCMGTVQQSRTLGNLAPLLSCECWIKRIFCNDYSITRCKGNEWQFFLCICYKWSFCCGVLSSLKLPIDTLFRLFVYNNR